MPERPQLTYKLAMGMPAGAASDRNAHAWLTSRITLTGSHESPAQYGLIATFKRDGTKQ